MPHEWSKCESKDGLVSWKCEICNYYWIQPRKPHPNYRMWYNYDEYRERKLMSCDEWVLEKVHAS